MPKFKSLSVAIGIFLVFATLGCQAEKRPEAGKKGAPTEPIKSGKVVAHIGSEKITLEELDQKIKELPEQYQPVASSRKDMFLDSIITQKVLYDEALKQGFDKDPKVKKQIEEMNKDVVIREYLRKEIEEKVAVSDEDAKAYYDANKDKFSEPEKFRVSHILVDTEMEARDILDKLKGGADFAALAKEKSKCPSKDKGGDLGFLSKGQTVLEFEQATLGLQVGQLSDVVKTQFGYHIIRLEEKQPAKERAFEEVKEQLKQTLLSTKQKERFDSLLKELKDKSKVVIYKEVLQPPAESRPTVSPAPGVQPVEQKPLEVAPIN